MPKLSEPPLVVKRMPRLIVCQRCGRERAIGGQISFSYREAGTRKGRVELCYNCVCVVLGKKDERP